jgi:molecular chaperone GrpE
MEIRMTNEKTEEIIDDNQEEEIKELPEEETKDDNKEVKEKLLLRIKELEEENKKLKNDYAKAFADTENTRKRLNGEAEQIRKYRIQSFALDILPIIDNLERALATKPTAESESYYKGIEMIYNQLTYALCKEGVEEIETLDKPFDHNFHQALMTEKVEGKEANQIIEVLQKGYKLKDRVLRASMVKVSE